MVDSNNVEDMLNCMTASGCFIGDLLVAEDGVMLQLSL